MKPSSSIPYLTAILSEGESHKVEFKESADKSLPAEVCAFANASGGRVFIGVDDRGRVVGTDVSNAARSRVQDTLHQIEPRLKVDIDVLDDIIVVTVPEGTHKPYSCAKGFYLRSGPNSQKLERNGIVEFFQNEGGIRYDEIVREDLPITERFNEAAYRRYVRTAKISDVLAREAILKNLNCAGPAGGKLCFTNAGALFFRTNDEDVLFRHAGIVCALYKGTDKAYILDAKELNGDLVGNVNDAMVFLKKHLRINYRIETLRRENILELPEDALREAVVNAVCHRDYFEKGARVMVEIYDDRVEIVSPGGACKGITRENFGTISITRNSILASMFYRIGYIEQMGTGIMRMKNAAREAELAAPEFELANFFKVTFKRKPSAQVSTASEKQANNKRITSGKQAENKRKTSGKQAENKRITSGKQAENKRKTSDKKRLIISRLEERGQATVSDFVEIFKLSEARVRAILSEMTKENTVEKKGRTKSAYYVLVK
jgi:ATP-dependent DNA helicase RecG